MPLTSRWQKVLRRTLRVVAGIVVLLLFAWLGFGWYVHTHAEEIKQRIAALLSERVRGTLTIGTMEPSVFRSFPNMSMQLSNISLRDSLWASHHHSLLEAGSMTVTLNPFALLSRRVEMKKVTAAHGSIFLFTDSNSYSNAYLLSRRDTTKKNRPALIDQFGLEDMHFWFINLAKQKRFHFHIRSLDGSASRAGAIITYQFDAAAHVHEMAFSTIRGSYLQDQDLRMNETIRYHITDKRLEIPDQVLKVSGTPLTLGGNFYFNRTPSAFDLHVAAEDVAYKKAVSLMSQNIRKTMGIFDFEKPLSVDARISGVMQYRNIPLITVVSTVKQNKLQTPLGPIEQVSFTVVYNNEVAAGKGHGDDNSSISMYALNGQWQGLPFTSDTLRVSNLLRPYVQAHIQSAFPLAALNNVVGSRSFSFNGGRAEADLRYVGGIVPDDPTPYSINGSVRLRDGQLGYLPRSLQFSNLSATLLFEGDNLLFRNISLSSRGSSLFMEGEALHFTRLYFADPGKVSVSWKVRGPMVNLNDFITVAGKRHVVRTAAPVARAAAVQRIGAGLDRALEEGSVSLDARLEKVAYKSFVAEGVVARLDIAQSGIVLQQVQLGNGGGTVSIRGVINQAAPNNPFTLKAEVRNADVARLFTSFDNFGQEAITAQNLEGKINAEADVRGSVTDAGTVLPASIFGTVHFRLTDGRIRDFAPFKQVGRFVFKKRNLDDVAVKDLQGTLEVQGTKVIIRPMTIQTSVVNMDVQGVYGLKGGTDIYLQVPLRNPEKEAPATPIGMLLRTGRGFVVHLRAQDPDGKGVRIGWDPLRKGKRATEGKLDR